MPTKSSSSAQSNSAPVQTFRYSNIKAAIWANEADDKTFYSVTFTRSYQDDKKTWHDTQTFSRDDLLLVSRLAEKAHDWIYETLTANKAH